MASTTFWIIFAVCVTACIPILLFYAKRSPNPRFRPKIGEVALAGLLLVALSFGFSLGMTSIFGIDEVFDGMQKHKPGGSSRAPEATPEDDDDE